MKMLIRVTSSPSLSLQVLQRVARPRSIQTGQQTNAEMKRRKYSALSFLLSFLDLPSFGSWRRTRSNVTRRAALEKLIKANYRQPMFRTQRIVIDQSNFRPLRIVGNIGQKITTPRFSWLGFNPFLHRGQNVLAVCWSACVERLFDRGGSAVQYNCTHNIFI